jgi:hypothetical protein
MDQYERHIQLYDLHNPEDNEQAPEKQHHAGDLMQHSQWSAMYILKWAETKHPLTEGVDLLLAHAGAYLHDMGKSGDCLSRCNDQTCGYPVYDPAKYGGRPKRVHAEVGADYVLKKNPFYTTCQLSVARRSVLDVDQLLRDLRVPGRHREMAVVIAMHWELGNINLAADMGLAVANYVALFRRLCHDYQVTPTSTLMRTCVLVSAADIAGTTPTHLGSGARDIWGRPAMPPARPSFVPWTHYGMREKSILFRDWILTAYYTS